jgi:hypothetical protein
MAKVLGSFLDELRVMRSGKWLTHDLRKRWKALCVTHRVFTLSRAVQRGLAKDRHIAAWQQGMGRDADPKLSDGWKDCT